MNWPFFITMVVAWMLATAIDDRRMLGTASILIANWMLCTAVVHWSGEEYPTLAFFAFDYLAAILMFVPMIFSDRPSPWQGIVGLLYAGEIVCHIARGWADNAAAIYYGWYFLRYAAWAQVVTVLVWGIYDIGMATDWSARGISRRLAVPPRDIVRAIARVF